MLALGRFAWIESRGPWSAQRTLQLRRIRYADQNYLADRNLHPPRPTRDTAASPNPRPTHIGNRPQRRAARTTARRAPRQTTFRR